MCRPTMQLLINNNFWLQLMSWEMSTVSSAVITVPIIKYAHGLLSFMFLWIYQQLLPDVSSKYIIIMNWEVWTITHCLWLGHETMVCAVYLYILLLCLVCMLCCWYTCCWYMWVNYNLLNLNDDKNEHLVITARDDLSNKWNISIKGGDQPISQAMVHQGTCVRFSILHAALMCTLLNSVNQQFQTIFSWEKWKCLDNQRQKGLLMPLKYHDWIIAVVYSMEQNNPTLMDCCAARKRDHNFILNA